MREKLLKTDPEIFFLKNTPHFINYVMSGQILIMLLILAGVAIFTQLPAVAGLFVKFFIFALTYKLAVDVLTETANGRLQPGNNHNPLELDSIAIKFVVIGLLDKAMIIWLFYMSKDPTIVYIYLIISVLITPAIFMALSITESLAVALNPVSLIRLIKPMLLTYLVFVIFWLLTSFIQNYGINILVARHLPVVFGSVVSGFFDAFFLVLNFHIMGFLIFQNRFELDFEAAYADDGYVQYNEPHQENVSNPIHARIETLLLQEKTTQALAIIKEIKADGDDSEELKKLETQAQEQNQGLKQGNITESKKIHQLISQDKAGKAFGIFADMVNNNRKYKEESATDLTALAQFAFGAEKHPVVLRLLKEFHLNYPNHEDIVPNYFLVSQVLYQNQQTRKKAKTLLNNLINRYPEHKMIPQISSWLKGIALIEKRDY